MRPETRMSYPLRAVHGHGAHSAPRETRSGATGSPRGPSGEFGGEAPD